MAVRLVVAVTDGDWFDHLRVKPELAEVNSGRRLPRIFVRWRRASYFCSSFTHRETSSLGAVSSPMQTRFLAL
jgi:hypothetical protein